MPDGTRCSSHFMTSRYAISTEYEIKLKHANSIMCPLMIYSDGVCLGTRNRVS